MMEYFISGNSLSDAEISKNNNTPVPAQGSIFEGWFFMAKIHGPLFHCEKF
jgi:hypothetical protein